MNTHLGEEDLNIYEDTQKDRYLVFSLGTEHYGIDIKYVIEIIGIQPITEVPELPLYIKGIINLRGKIIPIMDVRLRFKKEIHEYDDRTCIIVVNINETLIGLVVDRVAEVIDIPEENIESVPNVGKGHDNRYIKGIGKTGDSVRLLLDCNRLLNDEETECINQVIE
jgi:purine-binding chemotaxis protein CheW